MRTIHKYELSPRQEPLTLELPCEHRFLKVEYIVSKHAVFAWFEVSADVLAPKAPYTFRLFATGDGIPASAVYLGTTIDQYLPEAYHFYRLISE